MSERNLLITIIDTNPVWWGLQSAGLIKSTNNTSQKPSQYSDQNNNVSIYPLFR
jgi:hypothetical protein